MYEGGTWIIWSLGDFWIRLRKSTLDGLNDRWIAFSFGRRELISSLELIILIFIAYHHYQIQQYYVRHITYINLLHYGKKREVPEALVSEHPKPGPGSDSFLSHFKG
jgi:hypothetical protein